MEELLERIAVGIESLAEEPEIEITAGPPLCPHCGKFDPEVLTPVQDGGRGPLSHLAIEATCTECSQTLFVVVESYSMHRKRNEAVEEIKERSSSFHKAEESRG